MKILDDINDKEKKVYIGVAVGLIVIAATGYLLWRVNQKEKLSSEESEASGSVVCGGQCVNDTDCIGWNNGSGNVECNQGSTHRCEIYRCPSGQVIGPSKCVCTPVGGIVCGNYGCATDEDCAGGSDSNTTEYECNNRADGDVTKQQCIRIKCPTGYKVGSDKCSCDLIVANTCEGGGWTKKPTSFTTEESFTMTGYGEDDDGIDLDSIDIKINNVSLPSSKISRKKDSNTKASWATTLSGFTKGSYTVTVTWKDEEGNSGDDCVLSSTFTVTEAEAEEYCVKYWTAKDNSCQENEKCSTSQDISTNISGITTFKTLSECQTFVGKQYWQVSNNQCVQVTNIESALEKYHTSGLILFDSLSACQATLETETTPTTTTTTPQTGLLDEAWGKVVLGFTILGMGMLLMRYNVFELNWSGVEIKSTEKKMKKVKLGSNFEKKVVKDK